MTILQKIFCFSILLFCVFNCNAQKLLQIEKYGSTDVVRFYPGSQLTFKLKGNKTWYTRRIEDIVVEESLILFEKEGFVHIDDITFIQKSGAKRGYIGLAKSLNIFALNWVFWSLASTAVGGTLGLVTAIVPASAVLVGLVIRQLAKTKYWKMGKRKWLRVLDVGFTMAVA